MSANSDSMLFMELFYTLITLNKVINDFCDLKKKIQQYSKYFKEGEFIPFLKKKVKSIGAPIVYTALLMFYAFKSEKTPSWAKKIIMGMLGYLITPIDILPDLTPVVGYTDDLGILSFGLVTIACYITKDIKALSKEKTTKWLGEQPESVFESIDRKL